MKGLYNINPPLPKYDIIWDPDDVLRHLKTLSPISSLDLKTLTLKTVFLTLLVSGQRVQTLTALSLIHMKRTDDYILFRIPGLLKQSRPGRRNPSVLLRAFSPDADICVLHHMTAYISRTSTIRGPHNSLFISYKKPHAPVSKDTLSRWIKQVLGESGINIDNFSSHSVRSASTSAAKRGGATVPEIMATAGWAKKSTFAKYYDKEIVPSTFETAVLGNTKQQ